MLYSHYKRKDSNRPHAHPGTPRPDLNPYFNEIPASESEYNSTYNKKFERCKRSQYQIPKGANKTFPSQSPPTETFPKFLIWVKNEPFDFGILSPLPCPKIGINLLRRIAEYCREKRGHYPELSLNQWNHICKYKIQLSNADLCVAYFRVFDILSRPASTWSCGERLLNSARNTPKDDGDGDNINESRDAKFYKMLNQGYDANDEFKVNTLQFLLFLYIQHFLRLHKKFSIGGYTGENESWPTFWENQSNGNGERGGSHAGGNNNNNVITPEQRHAEFITANLEDIVDFLMIIQGNKSKKMFAVNNQRKRRKQQQPKRDRHGIIIGDIPAADKCEDDRVSIEVMRALSLILGAASITHDREFRRLDDCLGIEEVAFRLDLLENGVISTVDKERLVKWLISNLKINPWGPSSVTIPKVPIPLMTGICLGSTSTVAKKENVSGEEIFKGNKIYWNTQCHPKGWVLISNVMKQTLLMDDLEPLSSIKIQRCAESYIYLPGAHYMILIQKCHDLTLNIGVATKVVKIMDCSNVLLSGVGRLFMVNDTVSSTFHLLTPTSPIICGNKNHNIQLAPYNTSYPTLHSDMKTAGISLKIQKWNKPLELTSDGFPNDYSGSGSNVKILRAEKFNLTPFPFKDKSPGGLVEECFSPSLSGLLPEAYQRQLRQITNDVDKVKQEVQDKLVSPQFSSEESLNMIYKITVHRFKKWLKETGNYEQIVGLLSLQKSLEQKSTLPIMLSSQHDLACISKSMKKFFNINRRNIRSTSPIYYGSSVKAINEENKTELERISYCDGQKQSVKRLNVLSSPP